MTSLIRSLRVLRKHWLLALIAVFSLSIAMALGVLSLSFTNTFLLLPPAGTAPDRLVTIYVHTPAGEIDHISYPDYQYLRQNNHVFTDIAGSPNSISVQFNFGTAGEVKVVSRPVSDNYFAVLGIRPHLGRFFAPGEDRAKEPIAVMTYACWKRLGSDPNILGKTITSFRVVGVAPKEFTGSMYGLNGDLLTSLSTDGNDQSWFTKRDARHLVLTARLKPGVTRRQAQAEMTALFGQLTSAYPKEDNDLTAVVTRATLLPPDAIADAEIALAILVGLVLLVLLIASANVANLLLAVAVARRQEAAIKLALGAPRSRLIREFLRESAIICVASAALGAVIAFGLIARYPSITIDFPTLGSYPVGLNLRLDATVAGLTAGLMLIAILATGLAPALYASSVHLSQVLSGEIVVGGTRKNLRRNVLVVAQVAVCTLVLVGMGLCQRSLYNLRHSDIGFSARNLLAMPLYPSNDTGISQTQQIQQFERVRDAVSALPGIESVAFARELPLMLGYNDTPVQLPEVDKKTRIAHTVVDGNYFDTFGLRILEGRVFDSRDGEKSPEVVVVNRKMADTFWPGQNPLGKSLLWGDPARKAAVIGVIGDSKYGTLDETPQPVMYFAVSQHFQPGLNLIARTKGDPHLWADTLGHTALGLKLAVPFRPVTFNEWINFNLMPQRAIAGGVSGLSGLGLLLAAMGLFGAISYSVSQRKKELGIRIALGARRRTLLQMILYQTLRITGLGVAIGVALGVAATIILRSQFYGIHAVELLVLAPVGAAMLALSLLIAYLSAMPWISVDPLEAVRHN
jgi:predicted permease